MGLNPIPGLREDLWDQAGAIETFLNTHILALNREAKDQNL
jgi:hypothetical protein